MKRIFLSEKNSDEVLKKTTEIIKEGGLVVFPSDTVYGLLVDAENERAVKKLISFKNRPPGKPISVFLSDMLMVEDYVFVDRNQKKILNQLLPGPFTVILKSKEKVCSLIESEKKTLGIRIPDYQLILDLVKKISKPITATSANISGRPPHYKIDSLLKELSDKKKQLIDLVIDAGVLPRNKPSTIIDLTEEKFKILRKGDIVFENEKTYFSKTPSQTKKIAQYFLKKLNFDFQKPLIFVIKGEIGAGKTVFVKGLGEIFGINDVVSPSYVVFYEYDIENEKLKIKNKKYKFIHIDLYNLQEEGEFRDLKIENYLKAGNILAIEWGEKGGTILPILKEKGKIVYIEIEYVGEKERKVIINN